jgi:hypothetical protein
MKVLIQISFLISFAFMIGCAEGNSSEEEQNSRQEESTQQSEGEMETPSNESNEAAQPTEQQNQTQNSGDVAINPPHGEPGHDCAVPVGQPLNSGGTDASGPERTTTGSGPERSNATDNSTANLNPAHGQPGHDCSIPVGQPLDQ